MEEDEFGSEAGAEGGEQAVGAGGEAALLEPFVEDEENGSAREIAVVAKDVPGGSGIGGSEAEFLLDEGEEFLAAGMEDPGGDILAAKTEASEETIDQVFDAGANQLGDFLGEHDVEAGFAKIEAHRVEGVWEREGFDAEDAGAGAGGAGNDGGGGTVAEEAAGDEIGLREIAALKSEGGELDGDNEDAAGGKGAQILPGVGERGSAGGAAEFGDGEAANVGAEAEVVDEIGVEGRNDDAGAGDGDEEIDIGGAKRGASESGAGGLAAEADGVLAIFGGDLAERARFDEIVDGENAVAAIDAGMVENGEHGLEAAFVDREDSAHVALHVFARQGVGRERGGDGEDGACRLRNVRQRMGGQGRGPHFPRRFERPSPRRHGEEPRPA